MSDPLQRFFTTLVAMVRVIFRGNETAMKVAAFVGAGIYACLIVVGIRT